MTFTQSGTGAWTAATLSTGTLTQMFWRWGISTHSLHEIQGLPPNGCILATVGLHPAVLHGWAVCFWTTHCLLRVPCTPTYGNFFTLQHSSIDRAEGCLPS